MDPSLRAQLEKVLPERCAAVADGWYQAIAKTGYLPLAAADIRLHLADLAGQAAIFLVGERFDEEKAHEIGVALAQFHCLQPEGLGQTIGVLARGFVDGLPAEQAAALQPGLAALLEGVVTGFVWQARETVLAEQESVRAALVGELKVTEKALRESGCELEVRVHNLGSVPLNQNGGLTWYQYPTAFGDSVFRGSTFGGSTFGGSTVGCVPGINRRSPTQSQPLGWIACGFNRLSSATLTPVRCETLDQVSPCRMV